MILETTIKNAVKASEVAFVNKLNIDEIKSLSSEILEALTKKALFFEIWGLEDIQSCAVNNYDGMIITDKEAREIADGILRTHDCNVGIDWEVIDSNIQDFITTKK